jgi:hypothetical protein
MSVDTIAMTVSLPSAKAYSTVFLCSLVLDMIAESDSSREPLSETSRQIETRASGGSGRLARIRHAILAARSSPDNGCSIIPLTVSIQFRDGLRLWLHALSDSPPTAQLFTSCSTSSPGSRDNTIYVQQI